jgi:16S rRNA (cytosine967-C5)-methyltransferase
MRDESFAAAALEAELSRAVQLDDRDRGLATELVYGVLRVLPWIISEIDARAKKPTRSLPWEAQGALWVAVQQLFFMRVPAFAAVDEAVTAVRRAAGGQVAGFANALLRKLASSRPKPDEQQALRARAMIESCSHELRQALERALGVEGARAFLSDTQTPSVGLRVGDEARRDETMASIVAARPLAELRAGTLSPLCINAHKLGAKPQSLPGFAEGALSIQEEGSQLVALSVGAGRDERVLDACAGRGNKTGVLALAGARVDACDRDARKLERLAEDLARLRTSATSFAVDWTVGSGDVHGVYDAILVDAPCSGSGTLRRRPELALRKSRPLAERTAEQRAIMRAIIPHLARGGRLVYAVCSVLREEAEDVVAAFEELLEPAVFASDPASAVAPDAKSFRLLPHVHGCDGYFLASFRKRS